MLVVEHLAVGVRQGLEAPERVVLVAGLVGGLRLDVAAVPRVGRTGRLLDGDVAVDVVGVHPGHRSVGDGADAADGVRRGVGDVAEGVDDVRREGTALAGRDVGVVDADQPGAIAAVARLTAHRDGVRRQRVEPDLVDLGRQLTERGPAATGLPAVGRDSGGAVVEQVVGVGRLGTVDTGDRREADEPVVLVRRRDLVGLGGDDHGVAAVVDGQVPERGRTMSPTRVTAAPRWTTSRVAPRTSRTRSSSAPSWSVVVATATGKPAPPRS